ncbi:M10 family metallopeptidase C-terminal domain-containing protein [Falsiroseomonas sp. HW251]|uniref:M10 family metallopeptidase C-terminal domain-containing protein n=1 Tax=Falsiroseomonas sp. HW251 TaxID=3390998 RepID=UPI003D315F06
MTGAGTLAGNGGANSLAGSGGADSIAGNAGADTLNGGASADTLSGGTGNDVFAFSPNAGPTLSGVDVVTDFVIGADVINVAAFGPLGAGSAFLGIGFTSGPLSGRVTVVPVDDVVDYTAVRGWSSTNILLFEIHVQTVGAWTAADFAL